MLTDSHCHLASHQFPADEVPALLEQASEAGVHRIVTLATSLDDAPLNLALAEAHPQVYCAIGIHPCDVHQTADGYLSALRPLAASPRCVAIGETGLDYFHPAPEGWTDVDYHARQRKLLREHFELARELGKNVVIHTRDKSGKASLNDAVSIYREFADTVTAVFHCFLGPWENAEEIISLGGYLSFTGIATFKKATDCLGAATECPADRIMLETDSPYLAPVPHRGKRNQPAYTLHTAEVVAQARQLTLDELALLTEENANRFFKFPSNI